MGAKDPGSASHDQRHANPAATPQQMQIQAMAGQQQHYQTLQMQQQAHTAALLAARAAGQLPAAMIIPQHQQSATITQPVPVQIQVPMPVSTMPAQTNHQEMATAIQSRKPKDTLEMEV